jgi:GNAT superfamily N-acetyltransferase
MAGIRVRQATFADRDWITSYLETNHSRRVARNGALLAPTDHPMLVAEADGGLPAGLLTYVVEGGACEILTLHATSQWQGAGTALVEAARRIATDEGCDRLWVVTTNDNVDALRFYQRRGFRLAVLRPGAVDESRRTLKPEISPAGDYGIPLRDEIELEMRL